MSRAVDIEHLRRWIGAEESMSDVLTPALCDRFRVTLGLAGEAEAGRAAPRLIHFCLCRPVAAELGDDGHPARGGFLPPVPLPRRLWAGSDLRFTGDLPVGDTVRRTSRVADVQAKEGRTGPLCFVTVDHAFTGASGGKVHDRQTIVYRGPAADRSAEIAPTPAPAGDTVVTLDPDPVLLFRYSALTFNGHRIHYDRPYAVEREGYPGLVVHGPLQATLLFHLAARLRGGDPPDRFTFRSASALFEHRRMNLNAAAEAHGAMELWTAAVDGPIAMRAQARWP